MVSRTLHPWEELDRVIGGELHTSSLYRALYSTDASAYSERPLAVLYPKDEHDVAVALEFARKYSIPIIPRAAGTSLAGQVVGSGLVIDVTKYMRGVLEVSDTLVDQPNRKTPTAQEDSHSSALPGSLLPSGELWVRVQPGVVLDELNLRLKPSDYFFAPETSTSNRCCIGGMIGNNSCGSHSVVYGTTREHLLEAEVLLADGSRATFKELGEAEALRLSGLDTLEGRIYRHILQFLQNPATQQLIDGHFPDPKLKRRNTGYALDVLYFNWQAKHTINLCNLLAGSEGTLAIVLSAKLRLVPLPPPCKALICVHCGSLEESFAANLVALRYHPVAVELMDSTILELSKGNPTQQANRFFLVGEPAAILLVELVAGDSEALKVSADEVVAALQAESLGYAYPVVEGRDIARVWALRKAGLGLLSTLPGDAKPVSLIEDTAVLPERLAAYIADVKQMLVGYGLESVYHAHISVGELHIRPILNLKLPADRVKFRQVARDTALLVKKYRGSISGEHGDGRLRGEFIPLLLGQEVYRQFVELKKVFDPQGILNPGKIVCTPPMDEALRYQEIPAIVDTIFDFSRELGWLRAVEQCNGAGDCRRSSQFGGVMCPTFRVTRDERFTTRARANAMREAFYRLEGKGRFNDSDTLSLLSQCLACKGCRTECPSNVDMAKYKAEYLQHHYDAKGIPFTTYLVARIADVERLGALWPRAFNAVATWHPTSTIIKRAMGFAPQRSIPTLGKYTLRHWLRKYPSPPSVEGKRELYLFIDEFTNFLDVEVGIAFVNVLHWLGYSVLTPKHADSGRTEISKGLIRRARRLAERNVQLFGELASEHAPLVGIEPSAILTFREEYPSLLRGDRQVEARVLAGHALLYDEFLLREIQGGRITHEQLPVSPLKGRSVLLHGHCHQKALASVENTRRVLEFFGYRVEVIPSGCCGMAGAFGYESRSYELSMAIGNDVLFPAIRTAEADVLIAAPGTSCRQQIKDGTGIKAFHPVELINFALGFQTPIFTQHSS